MNNSGYFDKILFRNSENSFGTVPVLKYQYTEINRARQLCWPKRKLQKSKGNKYPNGNSYDMQFGMGLKELPQIILRVMQLLFLLVISFISNI